MRVGNSRYGIKYYNQLLDCLEEINVSTKPIHLLNK